MKEQKGITLIALIITIVVLLIIAVVTIGTVQESGIIGHAHNASDDYVVEQEKERIALAYSEYQIEKILDPTKTLQISGEDATTEQVGIYGWKVKYEKTGNVYGVNTKGEYDEAVTMVIKAVDEVSEIFNNFKTTNSELDIDGISLDDFIIYEDAKAISENAANINTEGYTVVPEKYVFYNCSKLTIDEIRVIETQYTPTPGSEKVENSTNRLFILDLNGDGCVSDKDDTIIRHINGFGINTDEYKNTYQGKPYELYLMDQNKNNHIANLCITEDVDDTGKKLTVYEQLAIARYDDYNGEFDPNLDFYTSSTNFLIKFYKNGVGYRNYVRGILAGDLNYYKQYVTGYTVFYELYDAHIYYKSTRPSSI